MNQIPFVPIANPMVQPQARYMSVPQQPNYNAVKIDIHNPQVGTQGVGQQYNPQYEQPTMPLYAYPQAPVYAYPQAQPTQQPYYQPLPQAVNVPPVVPQAPAVAQGPVAVESPVVVEAPKVEAPVVPAPVVTAPEEKTETTKAEAPKEAPKAETVEKPEVVAPETVSPQVDLNSFIAKLANPDFEAQSAGMEEIANMVKESPDKATELVDTKVFDALNNIVNFDSSKLEGPTKEQLDAREKLNSGKEVTEDEKKLANTFSPKEQAERNKSYALFTSAILEKLYADEVAKLSKTTVPLTELPGATTIVDQLKDNPNPMVRASAIEALSYIQNPEYKKDLTTLFTVAKNDQDAGVAEAAKTALEKLDQVKAQPEQAKAQEISINQPKQEQIKAAA